MAKPLHVLLPALGVLAVLTAAAWTWSRPVLPPPAETTVPPFKLGTAAGGDADVVYLPAAQALQNITVDETALQASPTSAPDPKRFVAANQRVLADHRDALEALAAGHAHPAFQAVGNTDAMRRYIEVNSPYQQLSKLGRVALHDAFVGGHVERALELAGDTLALVGRYGRSAGEPLFVAGQGSGWTKAWSRDLQLHQAAVLKAPTPALRTLLAELDARVRERRTPQDMALGHREWVVRDVANTGSVYEDATFDASALDRYLARRLSAHAEAGAALFRPRFDRLLPAFGRRDLTGIATTNAMPAVAEARHKLALIFHPAEATALTMIWMARGLENNMTAVWTADARIDGWRVKLACELYRRERKAAPASLAALVPAYLPAMPQDPFSATGAPLRFKGDRVWSTGPDGRDDGGSHDLPDQAGPTVDKAGRTVGDPPPAGDLVL